MRKFVLLLGLVALASTLSACDSAAEDYCEAWCDCVRCSDWQFDDCVHNMEHEEELADRRDCERIFDLFVDCVVDTYHCDHDHLDHDCHHEHDDWKDCVH